MIKKESCISVKEKAGWRWSVLERQSSREREGGTIERERDGRREGWREGDNRMLSIIVAE